MSQIYGVERRIGRFLLPERVIELNKKDPRMLEIIFRGLLIIRCEHLAHRMAFEYVALEIEPWGPRFAIVQDFNSEPAYKWDYADGAITWVCAEEERQIVKASG